MTPCNGILLLDKPRGITSNAALSSVKRLFNQKKAGHGGALDPIAEGMLPILFGSYTKLADLSLGATKEYESEWTLGATTDSGDSEGQIIHQAPVGDLARQTIEEVLAQFRGPIKQRPPVYSAIKYKGKPLYHYARRGTAHVPPRREVYIHALRLISFSTKHLRVALKCSKGVYVRSLATDVGTALGCGAYVSQLRRIQVGTFPTERMVTIEQLASVSPEQRLAFLLPSAELCALLPHIFIPLQQRAAFSLGNPFHYQPDGNIQAGRVCVFIHQEAGKHKQAVLLGLADLEDGWVRPRRVLALA